MENDMMDEETVDEILDGSLKIRQSRRGYRFNLDSIMLAHFVSLKSRTVNLDLGCGNGIIALVLARRFSNTKWVGLEIQERLAALAEKNVHLNGLTERIAISVGDACAIRKTHQARSFDNVVFNPPYRKLSSGRMNPLPEKAVARHEIKGSLQDFLAASKYLLKPQGRVFTIYPAQRLVELVFLFRKNNIEPKRMKLVFSDAASDAGFVLVEGRSGSREELKMEPPLYIYEEPKIYTQDMKNIFSELALPPATGDG
jgi:tRNA1Val (adenine37-N6)-methyltransferase